MIVAVSFLTTCNRTKNTDWAKFRGNNASAIASADSRPPIVFGEDENLLWKIATYISLAVVIGLILFNVFQRNRITRDLLNLDKTIAVLPFEQWSSDEEFSHLGDAIANEINTQLVKIKDFRVISFTSCSKFRGSDRPSIAEMGKALGFEKQPCYFQYRCVQRASDPGSPHPPSRRFDCVRARYIKFKALCNTEGNNRTGYAEIRIITE